MLILQFISSFYCYLAAVYLVECLPIEKYLLDSTQSQTELNWDKEAFGDSAEVPGWKEQSFSQKNGDVWRVHAVCDISSSNPNNWLRLPYVSREQANRLIIKLEYTIRECKKYPGDIRSCKETFQLLYIESDNQTLTSEFSESNYKYLKTIAAVNNMHASPSSSFVSASLDQTMPDYAIYRTEVELPLRTDKKGVYLVFRDQGACVSLLSVKVAYTVCSAQVTNLIEFPETRTGSNATDLVQQSGKCVDNAESIGTNTNLVPYAYCQTNGNWFMTNDNGICVCRAGYSYSNQQQQCIQCPQGKYKPDTSNQPECLTCPLNSWSKLNASQFCSCLDGFYRFNSTDFAAPCIQYPNEPQNLTIYYLDQTSIKLRWNPIETNYIEANTVEYKLDCFKCFTQSTNTSSSCKQKKACESYIHYPSTLTTNQVQLSSLDSNTQYMIEIYAQHTKALFKTKTIAIMARTYQDIASLAITNLTVYQFTEINQILLIWSNQLSGLLNKQMFLSYELRYWPKEEPSHANVITIKGPARNFTLKNSNPNVITNNLYVFQLRGQSSTGWGPFTQPVESMPISSLLYRTMPSDTDQFLSMDSTYYNQMETTIQSNSNQFLTRAFNRTNSSSSSISVNESLTTVIMSTGIVLCFFIVAISLLVYFYRSNNCFMAKKAIAHNTNNISKNPITLSSSSSNNSDCDSLDLAKRTVLATYNQLSSAAGTTISHSSCASGGSSPIWPGNHQTYIDPHTYEDPTRVVGLFAKELSPSNIIIESVIGGGEFGDVCKGMLRLTPWSEAVVAIKTLKGAATEQNRCDFLTEASIMAQFKDPNVVRLEGVVTQSHPLMIVTEYMENGSLDTFLRLNENKLKLTQMIQILHDVASGMRYLSDMNYIHRDLAARNILISRDLTCKVADFGLSRAIDSDSLEYTTKGGKIPIRWTAPEACNFRKYSYASDVWSFGVLAYEVLSFGERPYWNWENTDVIKALQESYRLPPPAATPDCLYKLMLRCWNDERMQRPRFNDIVTFLDQVVKCPVELNTQAKVKELMPINPRAPTQIQLTSTKQFLRRIKLEHYADHFSRQGLNNLANLFQLDTKQLTQFIQITNGYDQKVILDELERISQVFLHSIANNLSSYIFNSNTNSPQSSLHTVSRPQSTSIFQLIRTGSINNNNKNSNDLLIFNTSQQQQQQQHQQKGNGFLV